MSMRYKGGVISATPPTTSTSAATGVWTLVQQMQAQGAGTWPAQQYPGGPFWIGTLGDSGTDDAYGITTDSSGNVYISGESTIPGINQRVSQSAKFNSSGAIQWQRKLEGVATNSAIWRAIAIDSSSNLYMAGDDTGSGGFTIAKYNSSGTIQWQRRLGTLSSNNSGFGVALDSSANVYVVGYSTGNFGGTNYTYLIAKYDSSGVFQWQSALGASGLPSYGYAIAVDSSGNSYVTGYTNNAAGSGNYTITTAKFDTSGTLQWQNKLDGGSFNLGFGIAIDSSANVYVVGETNISNANYDTLIAKYNTSGTLQWQRRLGSSWGGSVGYAITVDSSSNVYIVGAAVPYSGAGYGLQIAKYNSSGTIQFQRVLYLSIVRSVYGYAIAVDSIGNIYVTGYSAIGAASSIEIVLAKLPGDGSSTGTYTVNGYSFIYAVSTLTDSSSTLTSSSPGFGSPSGVLPFATTTRTDSASTLTYSVTTL